MERKDRPAGASRHRPLLDIREAFHAPRRAAPHDGKMNESPRVSVIIPVFNLEVYLSETVDSVLNQTCQDFEIILVDDGSTDRSREIINGYQRRLPEKVRAVFQNHRGAAAARNTGIAMACGEWIAFLDGDDIWKPDKLNVQLRETENDPRINFLSTAAEIYGQHKLFSELVPAGHDIKLELLLKGCFIILSTVLIRSELLDTITFNEELPGAQDLDLYLRLADRSRFCFIPEPLIMYRIRKNAISDPQTTRYRQLDHHYRIIKREIKKMALTDPIQFNQYKGKLKSVMTRLTHEAAYFSLSSRMATRPIRIKMSWIAIRENPGRLKNYRFLLQALLPKQINHWLQRQQSK